MDFCIKIMLCPKCKRTMPNKSWTTKRGCIWCDAQYHYNKFKTIAFDLDGTICEHIRDYHPEDILKVKPRTWSKNTTALWIDIVKDLKSRGYRIIFFTRRGILPRGRELTIKWLKKYRVEYDELITQKPHWDILIDDRVCSVHRGWWSPEMVIAQMEFYKRQIEENMYKPNKRKTSEKNINLSSIKQKI